MKIFFYKFLFFCTVIYGSDISEPSIHKIVSGLIEDRYKGSSTISISSIDTINEYPNLFFSELHPQGFVILSNDYRAMPVLGYSFKNSIDFENLPIQLEKILSSYNQSIEFISINNIQQDVVNELFLERYLYNDIISNSNLRNIDPLITANWNQGGNWNALCPGNSLVGCVAVAMGQVMKYWEYPNQGYSYSQYYDPVHGIISVNFEDYDYNFSEMYDDYPTIDSQLLLYHSGAAVHMDYSPWASGASVCWEGPSAQDALDHNFKYNDIVTCEVKINYTDDEWNLLIKDQLDRGWPIIYRGYSDDAGHAWNMDGYQEDYYHCNWGWGGSANGYFYFDNLNGGGYNFIDNQAALLNIIPEDISEPVALFEFDIINMDLIFNDLSLFINEDEIVFWEWHFGDGNISYDTSPIHSYDDYGEYEVTLIVRNEYGLSSQPHMELIQILDLIGDINNDNYIDIIDVVSLVNIILSDSLSPGLDICDLNDDSMVNILDVILLVQIILE